MTALFDPTAIELPPTQEPPNPEKPEKRKPKVYRPRQDSVRLETDENTRTILARSTKLKRLEELVGVLHPGETLHLVAANHWSSYDLIAYLAEQVGPADLWIVTWSLSDAGVRTVARLKEAGLVLRVFSLLDLYAPTKHGNAAAAHLRMISERIHLRPCHAKVYVLRSKTRGVTVVTSGNLNTNPRVEAGVVTDSTRIADWHISWIEAAMDGSPPFNPEENPTP